MKENYKFSSRDFYLLEKLGIEVISEERRYWFVRTNGGLYFDDFYFDGYVGIEWDEIVSQTIENFDDLKKKVEDKYPNEFRSGYVASQINKFVNEFKKGDIVIIPNKNSKRFAFGEILEDNIFIKEDEEKDIQDIIFTDDDELDSEIQFLQKRRKVRWTKIVSRSELDSHLQTFIYAHNTIVDLKTYALYIDRMLSNFYIKGEFAYLTYRIEKKDNIPFDDLVNLFDYNRDIIKFASILLPEHEILRGELISKIDVQSKGPMQLKGPINKILIVGIVGMLVCGGHIKINKTDGLDIGTDGIVKLVDTIVNAYDVYETHKNKEEIINLKKKYEECKEELELLSISNDTEVSFNKLQTE